MQSLPIHSYFLANFNNEKYTYLKCAIQGDATKKNGSNRLNIIMTSALRVSKFYSFLVVLNENKTSVFDSQTYGLELKTQKRTKKIAKK